MQELVALADQAIEPRLLEAELFEEHVAVLQRQPRELRLDLGRDDDAAGALGFGLLFHRLRQRVAGSGRTFIDVADVEHGLGGQELQPGEDRGLLVRDLREPRRLALAQQGERLVDHG